MYADFITRVNVVVVVILCISAIRYELDVQLMWRLECEFKTRTHHVVDIETGIHEPRIHFGNDKCVKYPSTVHCSDSFR
jgi:hypothetical protein